MKVFLIAPAPPPVGGIESVTDNLMNYIKTSGNGTSLVLYNTSHKYRPVTSSSRIIRLATGIQGAIKTYFEIDKIIRNEKPDVIHLATSASLSLFKDYFLIKKAAKYDIPIVLHWHFGRIPQLKDQDNWEWKLLKKVILKSTMSIVIDNKSYETLLNTGITNVDYVPNPLAYDIELQAKELSKEINNRQLGRIIYVGHIIKNKGVFELVKACKHISNLKELILIGPYEEAVKRELINISGDEGNRWLKFMGQIKIEKVIDYMKSAPILLLPSYTEGFPMVILEGMALGCAIVATDVGAIPEMLHVESSEPCGICIQPQRVAPLKEAIENLLLTHKAWEVYGKRANDRVLRKYTIDHVYEQYKSVWKKALNAMGETKLVHAQFNKTQGARS